MVKKYIAKKVMTHLGMAVFGYFLRKGLEGKHQ